MKLSINISRLLLGAVALYGSSLAAQPNNPNQVCPDLAINWGTFTEAVNAAYTATQANGFPFVGMWATLMDTQGQVCAVYSVFDGTENGGPEAGNSAWLGSRVISAQKANTANAFSLDAFSIPTGAITVAVYEGGSLYGLQHSNPVDATISYAGDRDKYGTLNDPLVGKVVGGVNVFGGGIALYDGSGNKVGAVGVSGDTSCRDASMAWVLRDQLGFNNPPNDDTLSLEDTVTALFQQPVCLGSDSTTFSGTAGTFGVEYQYAP